MATGEVPGGTPPVAAPRRRGRPRSQRAGDTRTLILQAAEKEFAARGYDATSLRAIARRAGVDPSLVHHYFESKAGLFTEVVSVPLRPDLGIKAVLAGPREDIGEGVVRFILGEFEKPSVQARGVTLVRTIVGSDFAARFLKEFLVREVFRRIARALDAPDADLRATLAASQVVGILIARYVVKVEPLASAPVETVIERIAPVVQWHLTGESPDLP